MNASISNNDNRLKIGVVMDLIEHINVYKDTTLAMIQSAYRLGYEIHYIPVNNLYMRGTSACAKSFLLDFSKHSRLFCDICKCCPCCCNNNWYVLSEKDIDLQSLDCILMRKDPPFNMDYIYATYILESAEQQNTLVINKPSLLRNFNEKLFTLQLPNDLCNHIKDHIPQTIVTTSISDLRDFHNRFKKIVVKPLDGKGGESIFRLEEKDLNANVVFETLTKRGQRLCLAQKYVPEIMQGGDNRVIIINGKPLPFYLCRKPNEQDGRGNLAAGATGKVYHLNDNQEIYIIAHKMSYILKEQGIFFAGIDIIGNYLTEVNITSPTGIREMSNKARDMKFLKQGSIDLIDDYFMPALNLILNENSKEG